MSVAAPIRVLYCETNVDGTVGGSYFSLLYLVKSLDRRRFTPLVVFYTDNRLRPTFHDAGIETIVWPKPRPLTFGADHHTPLRPLLLAARRAGNVVAGFVKPTIDRARFLHRRNIQLVHLNNSILYNHDWMLAAHLTRTPCLSHERGINDVYPAMARAFGRRLDGVICISDAVRRNMVERGAGFPNLTTIHNGLNPEEMRRQQAPEKLRAALGIEPQAPVAVMVGNIKSWKGQETLLRAAAQLRDRLPAIRVVFVGDTAPADEGYARELRGTVTSLGLNSQVIFAGVTSYVADYLEMSDVLVHASILPEPFGRVILEAMACRRPVVGSRGGAITEIVVEGETGYTFPPGDDVALAKTLATVLVDRERARELGRRGYERVMSHFHIDRNVEATQRLYDSILHAAH